MSRNSLADHWKIRATVYDDRVEEIHLITDRERNIRRQERKVVWHRDKILGRGTYGEVRLELNRENKKLRAVKRITTNVAPNHNGYPEELKALLEFSQPKHKEQDLFIEFLGWFQHGFDLFFAMEYIQMGDLEANLSGKINEAEAREISRQILLGLKIMHAESFAHRDLKPQNIMVVRGPPEWEVKLADFGLSKRLVNRSRYLTTTGSPFYMAPEITWSLGIDNSSMGYTDAVDLWAMGCIAYRLVTGTVPFPSNLHLGEFCRDESLFPLERLVGSGVGDSCTRFIKALLRTCSKDRPSSAEALDHTWMKLENGSNLELLNSASSSSSNDSEVPDTEFSDLELNSGSHIGLRTPPVTSTALRDPSPVVATANVGAVEGSEDGAVAGSQAQTQRLDNGEALLELRNRAILLYDQRKYEQAEPAYRDLVVAQRQILGAEHQDTLNSMHNLANTLSRQGKYEEAEEAHRATLVAREQVQGPRHPDTLTSMSSLAGALYHQYKYREAEIAYRTTLCMRREVLGEESQDTVMSMSNLAKTLYEQRQFKAAEEMYRNTLAARRQVLGHSHRDTLTTMTSLANTLREQGRYQDAEKLYRRAFSARQEALGLEHHETLTSMSNLAELLCDQNKFTAAEELYRIIVSARQKVLGKEHPDTQTSLQRLDETQQGRRRGS